MHRVGEEVQINCLFVDGSLTCEELKYSLKFSTLELHPEIGERRLLYV